MPRRCEPCPVNRKASLPLTVRAPPREPSSVTNSPVSPPRATARCSQQDRVVANENPTSAGLSSGRAVTHALNRRVCSANAAGLRADTIHGTVLGAGASVVALGDSAGACSSTTCELVPLIPKEETAARRGLPVSGQLSCSVSSSTAPAVQSTCPVRSEEHTSELQSRQYLVCRLLLE